jgi:hypothetical protein
MDGIDLSELLEHISEFIVIGIFRKIFDEEIVEFLGLVSSVSFLFVFIELELLSAEFIAIEFVDSLGSLFFGLKLYISESSTGTIGIAFELA